MKTARLIQRVREEQPWKAKLWLFGAKANKQNFANIISGLQGEQKKKYIFIKVCDPFKTPLVQNF